MFISGHLKNEWASLRIPGLVIFLFSSLYLVMVICNHYFFRTWAWDYGTYNFAFYDYAHFRNSPDPVLAPNMTLFQDHFSFTLILLAPFYWILNWLLGTYTLAVVQVLLIAVGGMALYKLIEYKTSSRIFALLGLLQYFTLYGRWASFYTPFNIAIVTSSALPVFLYFFEKRKLTVVCLVLIFILLAREDTALWMIFIGLFLLIDHRKDKELRKIALLTIALSAVYFILVFKIFIPSLETPDIKYVLFNYSALGKNPAEAVQFMFTHPLKTIELLFVNHSGNPSFNGVKAEFYMVYLLFGGFVLFLRPRYLLIFIPLVMKKMYNDLPIRWSIESYYSIEFVVLLPIAVFLVLSELKNKTVRNILVVIVCINSIGVTTFKLLEKGRVLNWNNSTFLFFKSSMYHSPYPVKQMHKNLELIPPDAAVSSSGTINPHLMQRQKNYYFPQVYDAAYIAVMTGRDTWPLDEATYNKEINRYLDSPDWEAVVHDSAMIILRKKTLPVKQSIP